MGFLAQARPAGSLTDRVFALDALRGFDMCWMIGGHALVLHAVLLLDFMLPDGAFAFLERQFRHAPWGEPPVAWDLIMPLFLFVVGAAAPFALRRHVERGVSRAGLHRKIARRVLILWILGAVVQGNLLQSVWLFLNSFSGSAFDHLHLYSNTLQAIASGYALTALLLIHTGVRGQVAAFFALLVGYWLILSLVPVPGHPSGLLEPQMNIALFVDEMVLGRFRDGTPYTWILSSMGFACTVLLGAFAGRLLQTALSHRDKIAALVGLGVGCQVLGAAWSCWHPMIKYIWTGSFVLWAGGLSYLLLAVFYWLADVRSWRWWAWPLNIVGTNSLVAYVTGQLFGPVAWLICLLLNRLGIFVRI